MYSFPSHLDRTAALVASNLLNRATEPVSARREGIGEEHIARRNRTDKQSQLASKVKNMKRRSQRSESSSSTLREIPVAGQQREQHQGEREQQTTKGERRGRESSQAAGRGRGLGAQHHKTPRRKNHTIDQQKDNEEPNPSEPRSIMISPATSPSFSHVTGCQVSLKSLELSG